MNPTQIIGIIVTTFFGTILFFYWLAKYVEAKWPDVIRTKPKFEQIKIPAYTVDSDQLREIIKKVHDSLPASKRKLLTNLSYQIPTGTPIRSSLDKEGKPMMIFGQYSAQIHLFPESLFQHNENLSDFLEHFESLVRHELAHHFGMTEEEIIKNRKRLGITK